MDIFFIPIFAAIIIIIIGIPLYMIRGTKKSNVLLPDNASGSEPVDDTFYMIRGSKKSNVLLPDNASGLEPVDDNFDDKGSRFDVFLSFRGEDTRKSFAGHLYSAVRGRSMSAFMDSHDLRKGEQTKKLFKIIEESKILLPIFSKGYAQSVWCLREITKMVEMTKTGKGRMIPIFLDVRSVEVRNWHKDSQSAFKWDKSGASVGEKKKWMEALEVAGRSQGFSLKNHANGDESKLVKFIVKELEKILVKTPLDIAKHPIGMERRIQEVMNLLKSEARDVKMIGLQGMSGIGKTTIAKADYNELFHDFDGASAFISNVGEKFRGTDQGVKCQEQLIHDILSSEYHSTSDIGSIAAGKSEIKKKAKSRKVLIVLDDIDDIEQLQALAGGRDWFGKGSVIIITSKDEEILLKHELQESQIYKPNLLDEEESFQLFVRHAFEGGQPTTREEDDLSRRIARTAGGLPIALEVLGPHFSARRADMKEWKCELRKLQDISHKDVERKLRISYDGLEGMAQEIFLDISCFFVGADCGRLAQYYWEARGYHPESTVKLLQRRSLISLDTESRFHMHDLLIKMGREIVLQRRLKEEPSWSRTRLWTPNDIFELLSQRNIDVPSCKVEAIMLNQEDEEGKELCNSIQCFRNMHHLRLLHMEGVNFKNNFFHFPMKLVWLGLPRCLFDSPQISCLDLQHLVILNLSNCNLASLSLFGDMVLGKLKVLDLSSTDLTTTPDFYNFPSLEELTIRQCEKLTAVHPSIGKLRRLVILDMRTCTLLEELPDEICNLELIEVIHLGWCEKLSSLPEKIGDLTLLKELSLNDTGIRRIPDSVAQLTNMCELSLQRCKWLEPLPDSLTGWFSSGKLKMFGTSLNMIDGIDLSDIRNVLKVPSCKLLAFLPDKTCKALKEFYLIDPMVQVFPHSIRRLQNLVVLSLKCEQLRALPEWINGRQLEKLRDLEIESKYVKTLPKSIGSLEGLKTLKLVCENLEYLPDSLEKLKSLEIFKVAGGNIEQFPLWIGSLRSLRQLKVECSRIKVIPKSIKQLEGLEILELHLDNLKALPDSTTFPKKLKKFSLSCKDLESLPDCVWSMGELQEFSLRGCGKIEALPDAKLKQLNNLIHLDLSQTGVKKIPENICCLPKLMSVQITNEGSDTRFWFE